MFDLAAQTLLSPPTLAFALGVFAALVRSDLKIPTEIQATLSLYLLFAIGLKGGAALSTADPASLALPILAALVLGGAIPVWTHALANRALGFNAVDSAALAAHYGSVSAVTFVAATVFLDRSGFAHDGILPALVAVMEIPAILIGVWLGTRALAKSRAAERERDPDMADEEARTTAHLIHELLAGKVTLALAGGLLIGALSGPERMEAVAPFFLDPFQGVLTFFLLELGRVAGARLADVPKAGIRLMVLGLALPPVHATLGITLGLLAGLQPGGAFLLGVLAASASYIAAPAAVRMTLPEANPGYYLTASLAITFPFNLVIGLPIYWQITRVLTPTLTGAPAP